MDTSTLLLAVVAGAVAIPFLVGAAGFTPGGIRAGSIAAVMMSVAAIANGGGVASGSLVSFLQSAGATGLSGMAGAVVAGVGAAVMWVVRLFF